jgi:hypothetical protein
MTFTNDEIRNWATRNSYLYYVNIKRGLIDLPDNCTNPAVERKQSGARYHKGQVSKKAHSYSKRGDFSQSTNGHVAEQTMLFPAQKENVEGGFPFCNRNAELYWEDKGDSITHGNSNMGNVTSESLVHMAETCFNDRDKKSELDGKIFQLEAEAVDHNPYLTDAFPLRPEEVDTQVGHYLKERYSSYDNEFYE